MIPCRWRAYTTGAAARVGARRNRPADEGSPHLGAHEGATSPTCRALELLANRKGENLQQLVEESPAAPLLVLDLARVLQILREDLLELGDDGRVVDDRVELLVERERATVQIGASDRRPALADFGPSTLAVVVRSDCTMDRLK